MWALDPSRIEASVGKRIPVRANRDDRYFTDTFQALPSAGYAKCIENALDHPLISVRLSESFSKKMVRDYVHSFLCIPIDQFFDCSLGRLPYRSIKFEHRRQRIDLPVATINFTDDQCYTRMTQWDLLPNSGRALNGDHTVTYEIPCSPEENNNELYYPVRNVESLKTYASYIDMAAALMMPVTFCGRTGLFEYLDMVPAVARHLQIVQAYAKSCGG